MATKKDLIADVALHFNDLHQKDVASAVELVLDYMKQELAKHNRIELRGFGSFSVRQRKRSGSEEHYNTVYFRPSSKKQQVIL